MNREEARRLKRRVLSFQERARFGPKGMGKKADEDEEKAKGAAPSEQQVIKFLQKHPRPSDDQFHEWAEENGFNVHKAEATVYRVLSDIVSKGKSGGKVPPMSPAQMRTGVKVEKEHTPSPTVAKKIVADHVKELGTGYYPALLKMEKKLEKRAAFFYGLFSELEKIGVDFTRPFPGKKPGDPLTHEEIVSAVRLALSAEEEATSLYNQIADYTRDDVVAPLMRDVAEEEQVHSGEFRQLLKRLVKNEASSQEKGEREAADKLEKGAAVKWEKMWSKLKPADRKRIYRAAYSEKSFDFEDPKKAIKRKLESAGKLDIPPHTVFGGRRGTSQVRHGLRGLKMPVHHFKDPSPARRIMETRERQKTEGLSGLRNILQTAQSEKRRHGTMKHMKPFISKEQSETRRGTVVPSLSRLKKKASFIHGLVDEIEKSAKWVGIKRRLGRKIFGPPQSQLDRMNRKHWANVAAARFGGSSKDLRSAASSQKALRKGQALLNKREWIDRLRTMPRRAGKGLMNWAKSNPDSAFIIGMPVGLIGGTLGATAIANRLGPKPKKNIKKTAAQAGPPTLSKLRRAYPKGKVKPPSVADPQAMKKNLPQFPKAAKESGGDMDSMTQAFYHGLLDELEKAGACATPGEKIRSKGKGKGLARGKGKGPMGMPKKAEADDMACATPGEKIRSKGKGRGLARGRGRGPMGVPGGPGGGGRGAGILAKIEAARRDPSTKANPKDTGPKGSGTQDPRFKAQKGRGFGKQAEEAFFNGFDTSMEKEAKLPSALRLGNADKHPVKGKAGEYAGHRIMAHEVGRLAGRSPKKSDFPGESRSDFIAGGKRWRERSREALKTEPPKEQSVSGAKTGPRAALASRLARMGRKAKRGLKAGLKGAARRVEKTSDETASAAGGSIGGALGGLLTAKKGKRLRRAAQGGLGGALGGALGARVGKKMREGWGPFGGR